MTGQLPGSREINRRPFRISAAMKTQTINRLAPAAMLTVIGLTLSAGWIGYLQGLAEAAIVAL